MEASRNEKRFFLIIALLNILALGVGWTLGKINTAKCQSGYYVALSNDINLYVCVSTKKQNNDTRQNK